MRVTWHRRACEAQATSRRSSEVEHAARLNLRSRDRRAETSWGQRPTDRDRLTRSRRRSLALAARPPV